METFLVAVASLALGALVAYVLLRERASLPAPGEAAALRGEVALLLRRLEGIDARVSSSQTSNNDMAARIFETLGDVRSATLSVAEQAREFTTLQDMLKAPKARGGLGEAMLEEVLREILPPHAYATQHQFASGLIVDAVVRASGRLVCIDSKFPLANYTRMCRASDDIERAEAERSFAADIDKHIKDVSSKYVIPDEGTFDFAVMYVPAEGVYGEVLRLAHRKRPLLETAIEARVIPMSPLTLCGYLQTVLFGLRALRIEANAEAILAFCGRLQQDMGRFATEYETLGRHLTNAHSKYEEGHRKLDRFRYRLDRAQDLTVDPAQPDDPEPDPEVCESTAAGLRWIHTEGAGVVSPVHAERRER